MAFEYVIFPDVSRQPIRTFVVSQRKPLELLSAAFVGVGTDKAFASRHMHICPAEEQLLGTLSDEIGN